MRAAVRWRRLRSGLQSLLLLVAGLFVGGLLMEGGALLFLGEQPKFPRRVVEAPFGLQNNQPGARYRHKSADVNTLDVRRERLYFLSSKALLDPYLRRELLYWTPSHGHWTPFSHEKVGQALADLIVREDLLR